MEHLVQLFKISRFEQILEGYFSLGGELGNMIDGGAGSGSTAMAMYNIGRIGNPQTKVYAYEPFVGNHKFFDGCPDNIILRKVALGDSPSEMTLAVSAVVSPDTEWGRRGMAGYSSGGALTENSPSGPYDTVVRVVRADDDIPEKEKIGFVKLDLQGGSYRRYRGCET